MKFEVRRRFKLKPSNKRYRRGDIFETDSESLAEQLKSLGFLGRRLSDPKPIFVRTEPGKKDELGEAVNLEQEETEEETEEEFPEPIHIGGGWYQMPDGRKVRKSQLDLDEG